MAAQIEELVLPERLARIESVLAHRTRRLILVLENLIDPHNCAACLRSADAVGVQDVHVVEAAAPFVPNTKVTQGSHKWLTLYRHPTSEQCLAALRERRYRVFAATPDGPMTLADLDVTQPLALVFGAEHTGLSAHLRANADGCFRIPMYGFSQSLNVSVAVAVALFQVVAERTRRLGAAGDLRADERALLRDEWLRKSVARGDSVCAELERRAAAEADDT